MTTFAVTKSLDAVATNTTGAAASTDSSTLGGVPVTGVLVHIFGDGATTSSTTVEQSLDKIAWAPALYTVTNVSASGVILTGPPAPYTRAKATCSSGAVSAYIIPSADVVSPGWKTAQQGGTSGVLTSVGVVVPAELAAAGSPRTTDGDITLTWNVQAKNKVFAGPVSGADAAPGFRLADPADIPPRAAAAKLTDGAIAVSNSDIFITKGSALGSSTLATPTATTHDNWKMTITSTTAFAHVITVGTGKVNGAAATGITFTSAAIGDSVTLQAWQGIWYIVATRGTVTLA